MLEDFARQQMQSQVAAQQEAVSLQEQRDLEVKEEKDEKEKDVLCCTISPQSMCWLSFYGNLTLLAGCPQNRSNSDIFLLGCVSGSGRLSGRLATAI